jgi:Rap1a immunity proteins
VPRPKEGGGLAVPPPDGHTFNGWLTALARPSDALYVHVVASRLLALLAVTLSLSGTHMALATALDEPGIVPAAAMAAVCAGADVAACDLVLVTALTLTAKGQGYCLPTHYTGAQIRTAYVASVIAHRDRQDLPFVPTIVMAMRDAFPCPR